MKRRVFVSLLVGLCLLGLSACEKKGADKEKKAEAAEKEEPKEKKQKAEPVEPDPSKPATVGLMTVQTTKSVDEVIKAMTERLEKSRSVKVLATVDHSKNADEAGMDLAASQLLIFTNPSLEIPLVADSLSAGLDMPQKVLVWKGDDGKTNVTFNAPSYVAIRHGVKHLDLFLGRIESGLANVVKNSTGTTVPKLPHRKDIGIEEGQGIITRESQNGVSDTWNKLATYIEENDKLKLIAKVDMTKNAKAIKKDLRPAKLIIFGNPKMGTPLMQKARAVGLDLPQKMFVYENEYGDILVAFNSPEYLVERYGIEADEKMIEEMDAALKKIAAKATKEIE